MATVNLDKLNSFLRGEISAVETYRMALEKIEQGNLTRQTLEECRRSHEDRVQLLRSQIQSMGGEPAQGSGAWGTWAKLVQGGAKLLGDKATISALEEGEDKGLKDYRDNLNDVDEVTEQIVTAQLLPKQMETHRSMSALKKQMSQ